MPLRPLFSCSFLSPARGLSNRCLEHPTSLPSRGLSDSHWLRPPPPCSMVSISLEIHPGDVSSLPLWATAAVFAGCHLFGCYFSDFIFKQYNVKHRNTAHRTDGVLSQTDSRAALAGDTGVGEESQTARLLKANKLSVNRESNEGRKNKSESGTKSDPSVTPSLKTGEQKWRDFHNRVRILAY